VERQSPLLAHLLFAKTSSDGAAAVLDRNEPGRRECVVRGPLTIRARQRADTQQDRLHTLQSCRAPRAISTGTEADGVLANDRGRSSSFLSTWQVLIALMPSRTGALYWLVPSRVPGVPLRAAVKVKTSGLGALELIKS